MSSLKFMVLQNDENNKIIKKFFFLMSNGHSITQTSGRLNNQIGIEQPIKSNSLEMS